MMLDLIDRAFVERHTASPQRTLAPPSMPVIAAAIAPPVSGGSPEAADPVVATLLDVAAAEWRRLASRVEAAVADGARVVALAGRERGEGRTTVARGLVGLLRANGCPAEYRAGTLLPEAGIDDGSMQGCLVVDAGVWFPPGPVHRGRLARMALGCHAAILVRRSARPPCPAHEQALVALGIHPLGEVVTFAGEVSIVADPRPS